MPEIPMVVLGAGAVGKSCLTIQFIQGHFVERYDATIEDVYRKPMEVDGVNYVLTIVDTAGQDAFGTMRESYMKKGKAFVLVYSITDAESFQHMKRTYAQLRRTRGEGEDIACIVVANKSDLGAQRAVASDDGQLFATTTGCPFREVSAKDRLAVEEVFSTLVRTLANGGAKQSGAQPNAGSSAGPNGQPQNGGQNGGQGSAAANGQGAAGANGQAAGGAGQQAAPAAPTVPVGKPPKKKGFRCTML